MADDEHHTEAEVIAFLVMKGQIASAEAATPDDVTEELYRELLND